MSCTRPEFLLVAITAFVVTGTAAEPVAPDSAANAVHPVFATSPASAAAPATPSESRAVSPTTAAKLAAGVSKIANSTAVESRTDSTTPVDPSKPRNTIIRLPDYVIRDAKVAVPKDTELLTPGARLELALKRHPGARVGNIFGLNNGLALAMLAEEERLERKSQFEDLASLTHFSDPATQATVKREVERAFMREPDFGR